jgi:hypothetical protein
MDAQEIIEAIKIIDAVRGQTPTSEKITDVNSDGLYTTGEMAIVILQRGWVAVGVWHQDGDTCELTEASVIRYWGTDKGLGQLAISGPTNKTKLDKCGSMVFHKLAVVALMPTSKSKWT